MKHVLLSILILTGLCAQSQPTIEADGPLEFCSGESVTLCLEADFTSVLWSSGSTTQCITVMESGSYYPVFLDSKNNVDSTLVDSAITVTVHSAEPIMALHADTFLVLNHFESYQWIWRPSGEDIQNAVDSFIVVQQHFNCYGLRVTDEYGCVGHRPIIEQEIYECNVGVNEIIQDMLEIFPNPTSDLIHFLLKSLRSENLNISITDALGRVVYQRSLKQVQNDLIINVEQWSNGIYLVSLHSESGQKHSKQIVVHHE